MRLYSYADKYGTPRTGVLAKGGLLPGGKLAKYLDNPIATLGSPTAAALDEELLEDFRRAAKQARKDGVKPRDPATRYALPAVLNPQKIIGIGLNYADHAAEGGRAVPPRPMMFAKFANAIIADGESIIRPPATRALDLEVELGVVIRYPARRVTPADAVHHIAGYVVVNDVSARDWQGNPQALAEGQKGDGQWLRAKGSDTFLPVGPVLVTPDEINHDTGLRLRSWIIREGVKIPMQNGSTRDLLVDVPTLISLASQEITLEPGDLIITGTPGGVGVFRDPPLFAQPGDRLRCEVQGIGRVENPIVDWTDDPRAGV
jgi:2-keto-4-pentenoate hydratase/2-oxohepta-3-ene-1,7-dioic acid hydratase in catechol pathway